MASGLRAKLQTMAPGPTAPTASAASAGAGLVLRVDRMAHEAGVGQLLSPDVEQLADSVRLIHRRFDVNQVRLILVDM
jgi:hypothetical protein